MHLCVFFKLSKLIYYTLLFCQAILTFMKYSFHTFNHILSKINIFNYLLFIIYFYG